jgi:hypothetical protein
MTGYDRWLALPGFGLVEDCLDLQPREQLASLKKLHDVAKLVTSLESFQANVKNNSLN